jgi:transposase
LVEADNDATLAELAQQLQQCMGMRVSRSTLARAVQQLKLTVKKTFRATERDSERVLRQRVEVWQAIRAILSLL